ncbi:MAG: F0F1 ATP synthase subunit B [Sulfurimonas sp.]|nr:F0F1 ATP synthase subunit B [Sulfurimonas sp.]MDQ7062484.1 F0F1 ATP synthase subunit B [Sulfurimonas sp.]
MNRILVTLLTMSTFALASSAEHADTDIIQRTVNFLLFAGLVWYLVAEPMKDYFNARSVGISDELKKVQDKLSETISLKKEALAKISDAEKFAEDLAVSAKKENKLVNDNIMLQCDTELEALVKQNTSLVEFEQRKMVRTVVEDVLSEVLSKSSDGFDKEAMANVILKKVA